MFWVEGNEVTFRNKDMNRGTVRVLREQLKSTLAYEGGKRKSEYYRVQSKLMLIPSPFLFVERGFQKQSK